MSTKRKKKKRPPGLVRVLVSFPDSALVDQVDIAASADAEPGKPANRSEWIRAAVRERLRREGIKPRR